MDEFTRNINDVAAVASELVQTCQDLENRVRQSEFLLLSLQREFASWVLHQLGNMPDVELTAAGLGIADAEVVSLVKRYREFFLGRCFSCRRAAPLNDMGLCAWGCSPRSPTSMPPSPR